MLTSFRIMAVVLLCVLLADYSSAAAGKKHKVPADSIKLLVKDIDTTYKIVGVVGYVMINEEPDKAEERLHQELQKRASKKKADAVIFTQIIRPDLRRLITSAQMRAQIQNVYLGMGVAVQFLDSTGWAKWEKKHPPKELDSTATLEVLEKDVKRAYDVIGIAYGYVRMGVRDPFGVDKELKKFAKNNLACMMVGGCNAVIFTEYGEQGWSGWGVMVKYREQ